MLLALVFRGVTFEFRAIAQRKPLWNVVFAAGSTLAGFCQGLVLGGLVQGVKIENGAYAGGPFDWATPFGLLCGLGVVAGYALLGACWLMLKTDGDMAVRAAAKAKVLLIAVLVFMAAVSIYTPLAVPRIAQRWFTMPNLYLSVRRCRSSPHWSRSREWRWIEARRDVAPFLASIALFLLGYLGLVISTFPYIVPPTLTIQDAAAAPSSQIFMLIGTLVLLPIDPRLHRADLLAVPRQSPRGRGVSLSRHRDTSAAARRRRHAARPDHAPADPQRRQPALHRPIEGARHFGDEIGKIRLDVGRRRRRGVGASARPRRRPSCGCRRR